MIVYKYRSGRGTKDGNGRDVFERDIELLSKDTIYIPTVSQLNDPGETLVDDSLFKVQLRLLEKLGAKSSTKPVEEGFHELLDKVRSSGVYSLSKEIVNELMWAYYASGHSGYAIIFDTEVLARSYGWVKWGGMYEFDVKYSSRIPRFDISKIEKPGMKDLLSCLVGTKSRAWKHEAEHRLLFDKGGQCMKIDYRALKGFVFGCRMKRDDIDYVMRRFSGRDLLYYQMTTKGDSYKLSPKRLQDAYPTEIEYCPNRVAYDINELIEGDRLIGGVGYKYRSYVEKAMEEVCREPFVTGVSHIVVSEDMEHPHILIWTNVKQDGVFNPMRSFEYDVIGGSLVNV